jgi:biopolymer transport protein ExbD
MSRARRRYHESPIDIQLPITPMLDMSFQLLSFFVITFKAASASEGQLEMFLPRPQEPKAKDPAQIDTSKETSAEADESADVTLSLTASSAGDLMAITIREKKEKVITGPNVADMCAALKAELRTIRSGGGNQNNIKIEPAAMLKYARIVDVMDACLGAGYKSIGFVVPPDLANIKR